MIQRAAPPPTGPRLDGTRGGSRGGIQKRKGPTAPARIDRDGDLVMNAAATDKVKSGRGQIEATRSSRSHAASRGGVPMGPRGGNASKQAAIIRGIATRNANIVSSRPVNGQLGSLRVKGLSSSKAANNPDGGLESLLGFLERKASGLDAKSNRAIRIKKSRLDGDLVIISASLEDIAAIEKLDGFSFAGTTLTIGPSDTSELGGKGKGGEKQGISAEAQQLQDKLRAFLGSRYDVNLKLLNLSALGQDASLAQTGIFDDRKSVSKLFPALMATCDKIFETSAAKREAIVSVSLAGNELADVSTVTTLAQTFPDIKNLDLSANKFENLKSLTAWRWKFRQLENLVITNNPLETTTPGHETDLIRWYPKLQVLNGATVRTPEEIATAAAKATTPLPVTIPSFIDVSSVGETFILQFFVLYDTNRPALLSQYYDASSHFSLSVNTYAPRDSSPNSMPIPPWSAYLKYSRNLLKITHLSTRISRSHKGLDSIRTVWNELPPTKHPDLATNPEKYIIECQPLPGLPDPSGQAPQGVDGLLLTVHGEFEEPPPPGAKTDRSIRSFSRTFILGPGAPGGPQIRVVSDTLVLRAWRGLFVPWLEGNLQTSQQPSQQQQQVIGNVTGAEQLIMQVVERTGMNAQYAELCLKEAGGDLERAVGMFVSNKANLPAEAFINGVIPT